MPWFLVCVVVLVFMTLIGTLRDMKKRLDQQGKDIEWLEDSIYRHDQLFARMNDGLQYLFDQQTEIKKTLSRMDVHVAANDTSIEELEKMNESMLAFFRYLQHDVDLINEAFEEFENSICHQAEGYTKLNKEKRRRLIEQAKLIRQNVSVRDQARISHQKHVLGRKRHAVF